jgi:hypothetical protein
MKKGLIFLIILTSMLSLTVNLPSINAGSGNAGVGVLNVPPQFNQIRLVQLGDFIRLYITCSDYNSWEDVISVSITLEVSGEEKTQFIYKQYEDKDSYEKINEFIEIPNDSSLLLSKKCSYDCTLYGETVEEKCYLYILMVFYSTLFTRVKILITDRAGSTASTELDYTSEELARSGDFIILPGIGGSTAIGISPYLLDSIAFLSAIGVTFIIVKKTKIFKLIKICYGKG